MSTPSDTPPPPPPPVPVATSLPATGTEDRTVAIVAYITIIGFIIAIVMHGSKKTPLGSYHLRQALGLFITAVVCWMVLIIIPIIGWLLIPFVMLGILVLAIMGLVSAAGGQQKPVPILGAKYQQWFANAFN